MKNLVLILILLVCASALPGQVDTTPTRDTVLVKGQLSIYSHYNPSNELPLWLGGRYLPEINYGHTLSENRLVDFELSANVFGNATFSFAESSYANGKIKPYRAWIRYSSEQFELRAGLQKINFGSASLLRPLMWFDQIDPTDPLKFTEGVWGILARYYFLNNANIWLWGLYGNKNPKGWESIKTNIKIPEFGGRIQYPIPYGEAGISYHNRTADSRGNTLYAAEYDKIPEQKFGLDARLDLFIGCWLEASWTNKSKNLGVLNNQEILNLGVDYTFGIGNGLYLVYEQLLAASDSIAFTFENSISFSLVTVSYPLGLFDNLSAIVYFNWTDRTIYNFLNWQHQFNSFTFYLMGYWNPENYQIPTQTSEENLFAGKGVQVMLVHNH